MIVIHNAKKNAANPFGFKCNYKMEGTNCNEVFKTRYYLLKHRRIVGHIKKKKVVV